MNFPIGEEEIMFFLEQLLLYGCISHAAEFSPSISKRGTNNENENVAYF